MNRIEPQFVCLSMLVSHRAWDQSPNLSALDCLAYAIEHEGEELPPLVQRSLEIFQPGAPT